MQRGQVPKALCYDFKMRTHHNDSVGLQFDEDAALVRIDRQGQFFDKFQLFSKTTPEQICGQVKV